jgi:hypothetical protein
VYSRALIDKVLARYSGDWTTLRELIQNAADAAAKKVVIRFETLPSKTVPVPNSADDSMMLKHTLLHHTLYRLVVSNDGQAFAESDWNRLKRIAEGNPDETKIGAFGVGFYSVFADCEEPFVISGRKTMGFLWKGNTLYTRSTPIPTENATQDTCFFLNYRNTTSPIPDLMSICQFLSTSLTFVGLESIELHLDNWNVFTLTKKSAPGAGAQLPKDIKTKTKDGLMKIVGVTHQSTQIDAQWMNAVGWAAPKGVQATTVLEEAESSGPTLKSFFSRLKAGPASSTVAAKRAAKEAEQQQQLLISENLCANSRATVFLRISTVNIQTYVSTAFAQELERATKKPPPKHTRIAILTSSHDETAASLSTVSGVSSKKAAELFSSVLPTKNGRVFIGFPTAQTTGLLCHISAPSVIPTVERESIDLNARYVKTWNVEMLRVAGIACRIAYMGEMEVLKNKIEMSMKKANRTEIGPLDASSVIPQAVHVFKQYTAHESTPSSAVGQLIEEAFWECSTRPSIDVLSTRGILPSNQVRVVSEPLSFLESIPVVPSAVATDAEEFVRKLYDQGLVTDMTITDIKKQLEWNSLDDGQLTEFLKWAAAQVSSSQLDTATVQNLITSGVATVPEDENPNDKNAGKGAGKVLVLSQIKTFLSGSKIPADFPLPPHTIPFKFTKSIQRAQLIAFGWDELQIVPWFQFLIEAAESSSLSPERCITKSPDFASQALLVLSKSWDSLSQSSKETLIELLSSRPVIPTKSGLRRPAEAYFPSVKLFDDLPTIAGLHSGVKDKVLAALGVRKTIELNVVFQRLMAESPQGSQKWSFSDLIHYLVSVRADIPKQDIERLRSTAICPVEEGPATDRRPGKVYKKVSELFEPKDILRSMGVPILYWPGVYRSVSPEGRFLTFLGLQANPEVPQLVTIMQQAAANNDIQGYNTALKFFIDFHHVYGYGKFDVQKISAQAFLPVTGQAFPTLSAPNACYYNSKAAAMGYPILQSDLLPHAMKFGVAQDPPIKDCALRLVNKPPQTYREAVEVFGYLAGRLGEINVILTESIGSAPIVPITSTRSEKKITRLTTPKMCFLGNPEVYGDILDFVDFGLEANSFLLKVGSKHEPSSLELARMVVENPAKILGMLEETRYTELLRKLAENQSGLKADKELWKALKQSPFLLAYKEQASTSAKATQVAENGSLDEYPLDEDEAIVRVHSLRKANDMVIVDNIREFMMFRDYVYFAPQDDSLERFYQSLGVPLLTSLVDLDHRVGNIRRDQSEATTIRKTIIERSRLFLHEYSQDVRHDAKWLDKNLSVSQVESISLSSTLRGYAVKPHREKRTATLSNDKGKGYTLFVTRDPDLYEISTWIVRLLLNRPKQHDTLALEIVLGSDLRKLRTKGYNVDRILRQKAYETRLADDERKKQLADEKKRELLQLKEADRQQGNEKTLPPPPPYEASTPVKGRDGMSKSQHSSENSHLPNMPGAFGSDSPESSANQASSMELKKPGGLFSSFQDSVQQWGKNLGLSDHPIRNSSAGPSRYPQIQDTNAVVDTDPAVSERNIAKNLTSAIQACRSATSTSVFSEPHTTTVEEAKGSYCDTTPAQDISLTGTTAGGIKVFVANNIPDRMAFQSSESSGLNTFSFILLDLGSLFSLAPQTLHIFFDDRGSTIAFNQNGALFFNYHYFRTLHLQHWETSQSMKIDALAYWFVTMCHELAHNLVQEHSARHSFYAESFAQQFFGKVMHKAGQY